MPWIPDAWHNVWHAKTMQEIFVTFNLHVTELWELALSAAEASSIGLDRPGCVEPGEAPCLESRVQSGLRPPHSTGVGPGMWPRHSCSSGTRQPGSCSWCQESHWGKAAGTGGPSSMAKRCPRPSRTCISFGSETWEEGLLLSAAGAVLLASLWTSCFLSKFLVYTN